MSTKKQVNKTGIYIATGILILGCAYLIFTLGSSINGLAKQERFVEDQEKMVKNRLRMIRDVQEAYYRENDEYAAEWSKLIDFVVNGVLYTVEKKEEIVNKGFARDSSIFSIDTIAGPFSVIDSLFPSKKYPNFDANSLNLIPGSDVSFILRTDTLDGISVFEVVDANPVNPKRQNGDDDTLKVGSLTKVSTSGNWEK